jgi:PAS domain S-box-containing protein
MEKRIFFFCRLLLFILPAIALLSPPAAADSRPLPLTAAERQWLADHPVIRVAPDPDFPPLEAVDPQGEFAGIYISFLRMFEQKLPIRFELVTLANWTEVLEQVRSRAIDMTGAACSTPEREEYLHFTTPFVEIPAVVIVRDSMKSIPSMQALEGLKVAVVANYAEHEFMARQYPTVELAVMPGIVTGLRAVSFGHVDAMILNLASATYYIEKEGITNLRTSIDSGFRYQLAFPSRRDWPQLNGLLQRALDSITPEEREAVLDPWLGLKRSPFRLDRRTIAGLAIGLAAVVFIAVLLWNMTLRRRVKQRTAALEQELHERARAEKNLLESRKKFQTLFESVNDAVFVYHLTGDSRPDTFVEANSNGCQLLGYSREELLGMSPADFIVAEDAVRFPALLQQLREKGQALYELTLANRSGEKIPVETSARFFELDGIPTVISTVRDIRDRRRTEEELLKVRKLESIGVLAGGIAHDFNNILAAIAGNINVASHILGRDSKVSGLLAAAEKAALRARDLTQQLLTFSKGGAPVKEMADIAEVIRDSADFVLHGSNVACRFELPADLWLTRIDKGQISQVIQNIVINAGHAMPQGGIVTIAAENVELGAENRVPLAPGKYIRLEISDTGIGIAADHLPRIFDPYFTTKDKDSRKGSGLGLAVAHTIITRHGGAISAASEPDRGTTFTIYLPALAAERQALPGAMAEPSRQGHGKILVMDDEENVREMSTKMLQHLGYEVECVASGEEAIRCYREAMAHGSGFDLVLLDLTIPGGMGGKEAVQQILQINPAARVIVSSGYANDPVLADFRRYGFQGMVRKPYLLSVLSATVEKALRAGK